jgi:YVTN family beta-propeller protein
MLIVTGTLLVRRSDSSLIVRNIDVGAAAAAVDEQAGNVVVAGSEPSKASISVLDARSGALVRTVVMRDKPETLAVDPRHGHIFVASEHRDRTGNYTGPGSVIMLDARTGQVLHTVEVGNYPNAMAVDEHNTRVFVATVGAIDPMLQNMPMGSGSVSVLDARSGRLLRTIPVGVAPSAIAVDERAGRAFILNSGGTWEDKGGPDTWRWVPAWIRQHLPFLQQQKTRLRLVPGSVSVIDTTR